MMKLSRLAALLMLGALAASPAFAEDKPAATGGDAASPAAAESKLAMTVNGVTIPQERLDMYITKATTQGQQQDTPELRKSILDKLIDLEVLSQEATRNGLDKQAETQQQIELARQNVLAGALVQEYMKNTPVTDEALTKEYDSLKDSLGGKEYNVRHILVEKESDAKSILAKLKKGGKDGDFNKLAKAKSKDPGSKDNGGDLGWTPAGNLATTYVKPFADAVLALDKGQLSEPVQSQFGWHIIKVEDTRDIKIPPMEDLKSQLVNRLQQQGVKQFVSDLRSKAKVE